MMMVMITIFKVTMMMTGSDELVPPVPEDQIERRRQSDASDSR